jgi:DNA helicase IV
MSTQGYEEELRSEQSYATELYTRLDAERARVKGRYSAALRGPIDVKNGGTLVDRDAEVRALARQMNRLNVADHGLYFGLLDTLLGERLYIGRIGLFDEENEYEPVLLDWRAPAARAFYVATAASPENMRRRRQFHTRGRHVVDFTDEVLGRPHGAERGDAALLAAVNAPRGDGMRDIVATIQAEQDEIIRLDHPGVLVIEGGPGTGKTVVALHRVAYLLYTQRERIERHGVLVVGPNPAFLNHIGRVLPSLGETNVVFMTTGDLVPGLRVTAEEIPDAARLKGSLKILDVLAAAVADRQRLPEHPLPIKLADVTVRIDAETAEWAIQEARASGLPHNEAREVFREIFTYVLTERAIARIGRGWLTRADRGAWEQLRRDLLDELAENAAFTAALDELWPILTPETLLAQLYSSPERLRAAGADQALLRADGDAWTVSDVPLLDELADLLGGDKSADQAAERERKAEAEYAAGVLDIMISREDLMDDEDHLLAQDMLYAEDLADRFLERDTRELAERAAGDRDWTYRHVVVDEAQELSEMDWRVLMRRCPSRSFTVVGDLAQRLVGGRSDIVGHDAGAVRARPLGLPVAVGELPHSGGDHDRRRRAARRVRARGPATGLGPRVRRPAMVQARHRGRTARCHRGIRPGRSRTRRHQRRDRATGCAGHGGGVADEGPGVRRRPRRRTGPDPRNRPTRRGRALRRPHPRHPTPRRPVPGPIAAGPHRTRRNRDTRPGRESAAGVAIRVRPALPRS